MGFTFDLPETQEILVMGKKAGVGFDFWGVFRVFTAEEMRQIKDTVGDSEDDETLSTEGGYIPLADKVFIGWVNKESEPERWVSKTGADGMKEPLDCTDELREKMLGQPGVAFSIFSSCYKARFDSSAILGNSQPSPGASAKAKARGLKAIPSA